MIKIKDLSFSYSNKTKALDKVSLEIPSKKMVALLGPNGSGKSTLFKIFSTQLLATDGEVFFDTIKIDLQTQNTIRKKLGVCFQSPSLDPWLTVKENFKISAAFYSLGNDEWQKQWRLYHLRFKLKEIENTLCRELSGGQKRRVEILKAVFHRPEWLILDEPTSSLDPLIRKEIWELLFELKKDGLNIILSTHLFEEAELCDQLIFLSKGSIMYSGTKEDLYSLHGHQKLKIPTHQVPNDFLTKEKNIENDISHFVFKDQFILSDWMKNHSQEFDYLEFKKADLSDIYFKICGERLS